jgi:parvulin-like peptidyl-prolyl isomerase
MNRRSAAVKRIKLRHILIGLPERPTEAQLADAKRKAGEIMEQVRGGADFARLAAAESADASTKYSGGELGWIERGSIDTEWEVIVFAMSKGEVRGPITGPRGLHVFQVTELERNQQNSRSRSPRSRSNCATTSTARRWTGRPGSGWTSCATRRISR